MWGPCARDNRNFLWLLRLDGYREVANRDRRARLHARARTVHNQPGRTSPGTRSAGVG